MNSQDIKAMLLKAIEGRPLEGGNLAVIEDATRKRELVLGILAETITHWQLDNEWLTYFIGNLANATTEAAWWRSLYLRTAWLGGEHLVWYLLFRWGGPFPSV